MNLQKFCPKCGEKTNKLFEGLCKECYKEENNLVELPEEIEIAVCGMCGKWKDKGEWKEGNFEKFLKDKIIEKIKNKDNIENMEITLEKKNYGFKANLKVEGKLNGKVQSKDEVITKLNIKKETCKYCGRRESGYHEAIIQIRNGNKESMDRITQIVRNTISKTSDKMGFISNVEKENKGLNLYIGSKGFARRVAKNIEKEFNTERKDTYSLVTRKEGEEVYRDTILLSIK